MSVFVKNSYATLGLAIGTASLLPSIQPFCHLVAFVSGRFMLRYIIERIDAVHQELIGVTSIDSPIV